MTEVTGEQCQRCKEYGEDRRTLWMACFYKMDERGDIPYQETHLHTLQLEQLNKKTVEKEYRSRKGTLESPSYEQPWETHKYTIDEYTPKSLEQKTDLRGFYTLRVCKGCRGDWMQSIKNWFHSPPPAFESPGTGIYVRENGRNVEITEEEWYRRHPDGKPPIRYNG